MSFDKFQCLIHAYTFTFDTSPILIVISLTPHLVYEFVCQDRNQIKIFILPFRCFCSCYPGSTGEIIKIFTGVNTDVHVTHDASSWNKYSDVIMSTMASHITGVSIVYSTVFLGADQRKHQSSASLAFVRGIRRGPVNSPHIGPVTRKMFPCDDVIMLKNCNM